VITSLKSFFGSDSSDDDLPEGEVAQYCMVSWADEREKASTNLVNTTQEVDQVTLRSGRQLQPPESLRKERDEEWH